MRRARALRNDFGKNRPEIIGRDLYWIPTYFYLLFFFVLARQIYIFDVFVEQPQIDSFLSLEILAFFVSFYLLICLDRDLDHVVECGLHVLYSDLVDLFSPKNAGALLDVFRVVRLEKFALHTVDALQILKNQFGAVQRVARGRLLAELGGVVEERGNRPLYFKTAEIRRDRSQITTWLGCFFFRWRSRTRRYASCSAPSSGNFGFLNQLRQKVTSLKEIQGEAATVVQSVFRGNVARKKCNAQKEEKAHREADAAYAAAADKASVRIQCWYRGVTDRALCADLRREREFMKVSNHVFKTAETPRDRSKITTWLGFFFFSN